MLVVPLVTTIVSAAFALTLGVRFQARRRPYLLAWATAMTVWALAALTEVLGAAGQWSPVLFRGYYFLGGITLVGVLAAGTIYLLAPRFGSPTLAVLIGLVVLGLIGVVGANLQAGLLQTANQLHQVPSNNTIAPGRSAFNVLAILMAIIINSVGSLILIGGALWSAYGMWRRGAPAPRLWANVLIAAGAFIVAGASSLTRLGIYELFYVGQAIGVVVMFVGFLTAERAPRAAPQYQVVHQA
jgi:uncharacterized membrane protein YjjB (DUF3815 family)